MQSLSSRRAWIEIVQTLMREKRLQRRSPHGERGLKYVQHGFGAKRISVALLTESVDWNAIVPTAYEITIGRSPHGERGLKSPWVCAGLVPCRSLSSRRAWIEIKKFWKKAWQVNVALLTESVDWNLLWILRNRGLYLVALLTESVDWNNPHWNCNRRGAKSLSSRRAWIEISWLYSFCFSCLVALLTESVDWNQIWFKCQI